MCSFKRIAVSNRVLCSRPLPEQVRRLAGRVDFFLLREKDLAEAEYEKLATEVQESCRESGITLICHTFTAAAARIGCGAIHLPFEAFMKQRAELEGFSLRGVSVHTLKEGRQVQKAGADYVTFSPIFETACKPGAPAKGTDTLEQFCREIRIPVYALGGITEKNEDLVRQAGAAGACRMSDFMK